MMGSKHFLGLGVLAIVVVACGGGVSLVDGSQGLGPGAGDSGTGKKDCTAPNACGPVLGMPALQCPDGTIGGNTGKCIETATGCG